MFNQTQLVELLVSAGQGFTQSLLSQLVVISLIYVLIWWLFEKRLQKFRIQRVKRAGQEQIRREFKNTIIVILGGVITTPLITGAQQMGWTKIYTDINQYGWGYFILTTVVIWFIADAWFYWAHRLLHHPKIYRYIHAIHHESLDTTPYTSLSFHWLEPILDSAWIYIVIFLFPVSVLSIGINQIVGLFNNIKSHLGYEFYPKWFDRTPFFNMLVNSTHHNQHHTRYNGNYGLSFRFWDIWFGTEFSDYQEVVDRVKNQPKDLQISENTTYHSLQITKIEQETADSCSIYFEPTDPQFYKYTPGQHLNLKIKIGHQIYYRVFSLSSSPVTDKFLRITVRRHSVVTNYLQNQAKVGDTLQALFPAGDFGLKLEPTNHKHYLLVAGGSGITPLFSILRSVLATEKNSQITLLYANRNRERAIFADELENLAAINQNFNLDHFFSNQKRINQESLTPYLTQPDISDIYICGPDSLKQIVKQASQQISKDKTQLRIHQEDFADGFVSIFSALAKPKQTLVKPYITS